MQSSLSAAYLFACERTLLTFLLWEKMVKFNCIHSFIANYNMRCTWFRCASYEQRPNPIKKNRRKNHSTYLYFVRIALCEFSTSQRPFIHISLVCVRMIFSKKILISPRLQWPLGMNALNSYFTAFIEANNYNYRRWHSISRIRSVQTEGGAIQREFHSSSSNGSLQWKPVWRHINKWI